MVHIQENVFVCDFHIHCEILMLLQKRSQTAFLVPREDPGAQRGVYERRVPALSEETRVQHVCVLVVMSLQEVNHGASSNQRYIHWKRKKALFEDSSVRTPACTDDNIPS